MTGRDPAGSEWLGELTDGALGSVDGPVAGAGATGPRYRLGGELGAGAMGRVRAAFDTLLEREVALKQVRAAGDAAAEAALLREARVTAGLDHPAIIAVLDAGDDDDGQRFYAMRVVHGRSLAEVAAPTLDDAARTSLVRAVLQVAQAIAYAHTRGVVHRDLSPRNVRLGAHGEVVVMDWGLAARVDEAAVQAVVCGTPGYRAPELARGEPASPASDVWSLGALLHLVLAGEPPGDGRTPPGLRPELRSLLARALAPHAVDRYADAGELAADLAGFLDGGRVRAHRDRPWDRAARLARRHPGAIGAGALGLAVAAVVAAVLGTMAGRRAADARHARTEAQAALREMIVERAGAAVLDDHRRDAEALAQRARALGADAAAAGVSAAFAASPPVTVRPLGDERGCRTLAVRDGGERLCVAERRLWLERGGARTALDIGDGEPTLARFLTDGGMVVASSRDDGNHVVRFDRALTAVGRSAADGIDTARFRSLGRHAITGGAPSIDEAAGWAIVGVPDLFLAVAPDGSGRVVRPCPPGVAIRLIAAHPSSTAAQAVTVVWCADGLLVIDGPGGASRLYAGEMVARLPGARTGVVIDGRLVVGGSDARVGVVALPGGAVLHAGASPVGPVARIAAGPGDDAIVVGTDGVGLWRPGLGAWRHVAGAAVATDASLVDGRVVVHGAGTLAAWEPAAGRTTHRVTGGAGLGAVAWSADGTWVAFGGGDGGVHVLAPASGAVKRTAVTDQVVKSLAFSPDGATLAVGVATNTGGLHLLDADGLVDRGGAWLEPQVGVRRLAFLGSGDVLAFAFGLRLWFAELGRFAWRDVPTLREPVSDVAVPVRAGVVFALGTHGALGRHDDAGETRLRDAPGATAVALSGDGRVLALISEDGRAIELRDAASDGARGTLAAPGARIEDAALDPVGERLALARIDGTVEIWRLADRRLVLSLRAHAGRAAAVAFSPDGCTLATAGWDAVGRLLALCAQPGALQ